MPKPLTELTRYYPVGKHNAYFADSFGVGSSASHPPAGGTALSRQRREGTGLAGKEGRAREIDLARIFVLFYCKLLWACGPLYTTMVHPDLTQPV